MLDIGKRFTYHGPNEDQIRRYNEIRTQAREFAYKLKHDCPESRELSLAITKLEEVVMWANAAIARNETQA